MFPNFSTGKAKLLVRIAWVWIFSIHLLLFVMALLSHSFLTDDSIQYLTLSDNFLDFGLFSQSYVEPIVSDAQRTPGYPLFLILMGMKPFFTLLFQHLLVFASGWFLYKSFSLKFDQKKAYVFALFYLIQPYPILFASLFLAECLFIFLLLAATYQLFRYFENTSWTQLIEACLLLVIAAYVKPVGIVLIPLLIALVIAKHRNTFQKQFLHIVVAIMIPVLLITPWMWRNQQVSGNFSFSEMADMGFIYGRLGGLVQYQENGELDELNLYLSGDRLIGEELGLENVKSYADGKQRHETEKYHPDVKAITFSYYLSNPLDAISFHFGMLFNMLKGIGYGWAMKLTASPLISTILSTIQALCNLLMFIGFLLSFWKIKQWRLQEYFWVSSILAVLMLSSVAWADGRYRMIIDPFLIGMMLFSWEYVLSEINWTRK